MMKSIVAKAIAGVLSVAVSAAGIVAYNANSAVHEQKAESVQVVEAEATAASDVTYDWAEAAEKEGFDESKIQSAEDEQAFIASIQNGKTKSENEKTGAEQKTGKVTSGAAPVVSAKTDAAVKTDVSAKTDTTVQAQNAQVQGQNENQNAAVQQAEKERLAAEKAEAEKAEKERLAAEKAEKERLAAEKAEKERLAAEKAEKERLAAEKAEKERLAAEKAEAERIAAEKAEAERIAAEKAEAERLAAEAEAQRIAAEQAEKEAFEKSEASSTLEIPEEKQPIIKKIIHWNCVCGADFTDKDAFMQHALEGSRRGEQHNYHNWTEEIEVYE